MIIKRNYVLYKTPEYQKWLGHENDRVQAQIANRLSKIEWSRQRYYQSEKNLQKVRRIERLQ